MRSIPRARLHVAIDKVCRQEADWWEDDLDVAIFRLFDDRELRRQPRLIERFIEEPRPPDPTGMYDALEAIESRVYQHWAIVDPFLSVDNDYRDEAPNEAFRQPLGFRDAEGNFIATPSLSPLPNYCSRIDDACSMKCQAFGSQLLLHWQEVPGEWGVDYEAALLGLGGRVVSEFRSDRAALAIVGAVLLAMESAGTQDLANFQVVG